MSESMTLDQFRQARQTGVDLYAEQPPEVQEDAAPEQLDQQEVEQDQPVDMQDDIEVDDAPAIPQDQQSAWQKRAERERRKGAEEAEIRLKAEYEDQINPYKAFFEKLGVNPEEAMRVMEQNKIREESRRVVAADAQQLAYQYGWDEQQTEEYINRQADVIARQRQQDEEVHSLRISVAINDLADNKDFPGIKQMKSQISEFIRNNPRVPVEQAYWAVGGASLATQLKRETEQREIAKRSQTSRKVVTDSGTATDTKGALPAEAIEFMRREGMSESQIRVLMGDAPKNLAEYRKMNKGRP